MGRRWKIFLPLAIVAPGLAAWLGFRQEGQRLETGNAAPPLRTTLKRIFVRPPDSVVRLNELRGRARGSQLTSREAAECWQIIRDFDLAQVRSYLAELPAGETNGASETLMNMLSARWAQLDPQGAAESMEKMLAAHGSGPIRAVLAIWLARDPAAALQWVGIERTPPGNVIPTLAGLMAGPLFVRQDPQTALERASRECPAARTSVMMALALRGSTSEENRQQFFDLTKDLRDDKGWKRAATQLARTWAENDPAGALSASSQAGAYGMTDEQRANFRQNVVERVANTNPVLALDSLQATPGDAPLRDRIYNGYSYGKPQEAADWAVKSGQLELMVGQMQRQTNWELSGSHGDRQQSDRIRIQYRTWQQNQPDAAAGWFASLPASFRDKLNSPAADATH
ncbi:MAG: hypothetical protein JWO82_4216 [Akkermansiaceae bacterium]|nr:hypothetical protein [Akkermansiaceae bacterium]